MKKIDTKKDNIKNIVSLIITFLILFANSINLKYVPKKPLNNLKSTSWILTIIIFIALYKFIKSRLSKPKKSILATSFIMSVIYTLSYFLNKYETIKYAFINPIQIIKTIIVIVGYTCFTYFLLDYVFEKIKQIEFKKTTNKIIDFVFNKHPFISSFIIVLIFYIPIMYIFYPGVLQGDGFDEIRQYNHSCTWSLTYINLIDPGMYINGHHSPFHTVILGFIFNFFRGIGGAKFGIFAYVLLQVIIQAAALAYSIRLMKKLKVNYLIRIIALACYCILPWFSINSVGVFKDILFSCAILMYVCCLIEYVYLKEEKLINLIKLIILAILVILLTNKGIYMIILVTLFLIIKYWKKKYVVVLLLIPILFNVIYNKVILPSFHVTPGSIQETLSLPIQQVSRYVVYHGDELTNEEKANIKGLLNYDKIVERYKATTADPIKNDFNVDYTKEDVKKFLETWVALFFKHPGTYVNAFVNMYDNYFYYDHDSVMVYYISKSSKIRCDSLLEELQQPHQGAIGYTSKFWLLARKVPIIGALLNISFYDWVLILSILYLIVIKKTNNLIPFIPSIVILLFCLVSPVNGNKRYIYPIVYLTPLLISYLSVLHYKKNK